ncbi:MAG: Eco57I restriction-modification methylase domain-containing protein [Fimbriimonadales bacterium]|nr:Eco57I restriction-modification methylase domain-containing protein [Fimbriimonadales bacterium]
MKNFDAHSRALGYVPTPPEVVAFMVHLAAPPTHAPCAVLEPACADARFLHAFRQAYGNQHRLVGVELNPEAAQESNTGAVTAPVPRMEIIIADFLLWDTSERFDVILGNPPYGIVGDASHYPIHLLKERKPLYKHHCTTWKGKYNLYGAFMEKAARLLKPNGKLVFIVPTTWLILDDFALLRRFLAERGHLEVFYVGRVFRGVNVSAVIVRFIHGKRGLALYDMANGEWQKLGRNGMGKATSPVPKSPVVSKLDYAGELIRFETPEWLTFEQSGVPLGELFHIHFAARSPEFRKSRLIRTASKAGYVPVLTGRNLSVGRIDYDTCYSGWWMRREDAPKLRQWYAEPHLVVGHTKGVRLVCAVDWQCYPWREEYHLLLREGVQVDWEGLERYLNSEQVQAYLQALYRDFTPHLTKTMLKRVPVPTQYAALE